MSREIGLSTFQTGGHSRQVQFAWNSIVAKKSRNWEMVFPDRVVFPEGIVPDRFDCILLPTPCEIYKSYPTLHVSLKCSIFGIKYEKFGMAPYLILLCCEWQPSSCVKLRSRVDLRGSFLLALSTYPNNSVKKPKVYLGMLDNLSTPHFLQLRTNIDWFYDAQNTSSYKY